MGKLVKQNLLSDIEEIIEHVKMRLHFLKFDVDLYLGKNGFVFSRPNESRTVTLYNSSDLLGFNVDIEGGGKGASYAHYVSGLDKDYIAQIIIKALIMDIEEYHQRDGVTLLPPGDENV